MKKILLIFSLLVTFIINSYAQPERIISTTSVTAYTAKARFGNLVIPVLPTPPTLKPSLLNGSLDSSGAIYFSRSDTSLYVYLGGTAYKRFYVGAGGSGPFYDSTLMSSVKRLRDSLVVIRTFIGTKQNTLALTTTGSGPATLNVATGAFNIPINIVDTTPLHNQLAVLRATKLDSTKVKNDSTIATYVGGTETDQIIRGSPYYPIVDTSTCINVRRGVGNAPDTLYCTCCVPGGGGGTTVTTGNLVFSIDSVKTTRPSNGTIRFAQNYQTAGDLAQGTYIPFIYNSTSTATADNSTVLMPSIGSGAGRWLLYPINKKVNTYELGLFGSGVLTYPFQAAVNYAAANSLELVLDQDYTTSTVTLPTSLILNLNGHSWIISNTGTTQLQTLALIDSTFPRRKNITIKNGYMYGQQTYSNGTFGGGSINKDSSQNLIVINSADSITLSNVFFGNTQHAIFIRGSSYLTMANWGFDNIGGAVVYDYYDTTNHNFDISGFYNGGKWGLYYAYDLGGPMHGSNIAPIRYGDDIFEIAGYRHHIYNFYIKNPGTHWFFIEARIKSELEMDHFIADGNNLSGMGVSVGGATIGFTPLTGFNMHDFEFLNIVRNAPSASDSAIGYTGKIKYFGGDYNEIGNCVNCHIWNSNEVRNIGFEFRPFRNIEINNLHYKITNFKDPFTGAKNILSLGNKDNATTADTSSYAHIHDNTYDSTGDAFFYHIGAGEVVTNVTIENEHWNTVPTYYAGGSDGIAEILAPTYARKHSNIKFKHNTLTGYQALYQAYFIQQNSSPSTPNIFLEDNDYTLSNITKSNLIFSEDSYTPNFYRSLNKFSDGTQDNIPISSISTGTPDGTKFVADDGTLKTPTTSGGTTYTFPGTIVAPSNAVKLTNDSTPGPSFFYGTNTSARLGYYPFPSSGGLSGLTSGRVNFSTSATTIGDDGNLLWDNTNKKLSVTSASGSTFVDFYNATANAHFFMGFGGTSNTYLDVDQFNIRTPGAGSGHSIYTYLTRVGLNGINSTPVAGVEIGAGTTSVAPFVIDAGTNLTTPLSGAIEYNGTHFYGTVGSTRYQLDQQSGGGFTSPMTTTGDMIYSSSGSTAARLGIGTASQKLGVVGGIPAWRDTSGDYKIILVDSGTLSQGTAKQSIATTLNDGITHYYQISIDMNIVTSGSMTSSVDYVYTDQYNNTITRHVYEMGASVSGVSGAGPSNFPLIGAIRCKPNTNIVVQYNYTFGTGTFTYNFNTIITQIR